MLEDKIIELWHISRTALATQDSSRHSRMLYIKKELQERNPELVSGMTYKEIWFTIENTLSHV